MLLTTKARYAVMALVDMAYLEKNNKPVALYELSGRQNLDLNYMEQIFAKLRKSGLIKSIKGPGGGYLLSRTSNEIFISDIVKSVDESTKMTRCEGEVGCMPDKSRCLTHDLWEGLSNHIDQYLSRISLADVCSLEKTKKPCNSKILSKFSSDEKFEGATI